MSASGEASGGRWRWAPLGFFLLGLGVMGGLAWDRVGSPSTDPHFVYQANAFLAGELELQRPPPHRNDWAQWEVLRLRSGEVLKGVWVDRGAGRFEALGGAVYQIDRGELTPGPREVHTFVSFPPLPAVLMVPLAWVWGYAVDDVSFTVFFGALNLALCWWLLEALRGRGRSGRARWENAALTVLFGLGTVHLSGSVLGQVWFTALIVGATCTLLYMLAALDARRPFLAGLAFALGVATRTPIAFSVVFFLAFVLFPEGRLRRGGWGEAARKVAWFGLPCVVVAGLLMAMNAARFEDALEFGHRYLGGTATERIRAYGMFHPHFLSRNLSAALTLLPQVQGSYPWVTFSRHGMSLLLTTPAWGWLLWPRASLDAEDRRWRWALGLTAAAMALPGLFYQNTGFEQFGYRFSVDYTPYLIALLAMGRRPLTRALWVAIGVGVAVNVFGAVTFKRFQDFYMSGGRFFE